MQRTVPHTSTDTIDLFMRTYYSLLRTTDAVPIQSLVESYMAMESSLHIDAREDRIDISTLVYASLRLPSCVLQVELVVMGQTEDVFENYGFPISQWERAYAPGRRRRMHWDGRSTLGVYLSSRSDVDDLLPMLTAYQIEWNKVYDRLRQHPVRELLKQFDTLADFNVDTVEEMAKAFGVDVPEFVRLSIALGSSFIPTLRAMTSQRKSFKLKQLGGSLADYRKAYARWWANLRDSAKEPGHYIEESPVYFVSSNLHSVVNLFSGYAMRKRDEILSFLHELEQDDLLQEYEIIQTDEALALNEPNFLYYAFKKYMAAHPEVAKERAQAEKEIGIHHIPSQRGFDVGAQVVPINRLRHDYLDPRLMGVDDFDILRHSNALIINIDYPLGVSAYELLSYLSARVGRLMGVYIMGKAATLNGAMGDVMIPNVVHDEHSNNTYLFSNVFNANHVSPYMTLGSVLDNQKAVTSYGTFLQNPMYMDVFYEEGYTIVEMEAGPYLSAVYESVRPRRHPNNEIVRLYEANLDVGVIHYASDTPFSKGHNLGAGSMGYRGIEPTYAAAIAILRHILRQEEANIREGSGPFVSGTYRVGAGGLKIQAG